MNLTTLTNRLPHRLQWVALFAWLASASAQNLEMALVRPLRPTLRDPPAFISSVNHRVAVASNHAYVVDSGYLSVYRLSEGAARQIGAYPTGGSGGTVYVDGNHAFVTSSPSGFAAFDVRDPTRLRRLDSSEFTLEEMFEVIRGERSDEGGIRGAVAAIVANQLYIAREDIGVATIQLGGAFDEAMLTRPISAEPVLPASETPPKAPPINISLREIRAPGFLPAPRIRSEFVTHEAADLLMPRNGGLVAVERPPLVLSASVEEGVVVLGLSGPVGQTVRIQRSFSIQRGWADWQTVTLGNGPVEWVDLEGASADQIFYRAVE